MNTAFLKYWKVIVLAVALAAAFIYHRIAVNSAYNEGVEHQQGLQAKADVLRADLLEIDKERIEQNAQNRINAAEVAAAKSDAAVSGLRKQLSAIKQLAESNTGVVSPGSSARDAVVLLANMLGQCSEEYSKLAGFADSAHQRGLAAEESYDSLRK